MAVDYNHINIEWIRKGLREDESVRLVVKRHWIVFVYTGLYALFLIVSTALVLAFEESIFSLFGREFLYVSLIVYWCAYLLFLYIHWVNNELDLFLITDRRIRGLEQLSFLNRTVSECSLGDIEEVNAQTKWLLPNLFGFGTVTMHTASEKSDFTMNYAPDALNAAATILNVIQDYKHDRKE